MAKVEKKSNTNSEIETVEAQPMPPQNRVYKGSQVVDHDLFKLQVATMVKNVSYNDVPDYKKFEHCHIFHTVDSNGKRQETCNAVGGHFHNITVHHNTAGVPTIEVSAPMVWVNKKIKGVFQRVAVAMEFEDPEHYHTHEPIYLGSEKIKLRETNMEAAKFETMLKQKQSPSIDGVVAT